MRSRLRLLSNTSDVSSVRSSRADWREIRKPRNPPRAVRIGGRDGGSARNCRRRVLRRLDAVRAAPKIHVGQRISPVPALDHPALGGALDAGVQSRSAPTRVQRATKAVIAFLAVPVAALLSPLLRRLDNKLLDIAAGHRAAWPMGDPLLECVGLTDDDVAVTGVDSGMDPPTWRTQRFATTGTKHRSGRPSRFIARLSDGRDRERGA